MGFNGFLWVQYCLSEKGVGAAAPTAPTLTRTLNKQDTYIVQSDVLYVEWVDCIEQVQLGTHNLRHPRVVHQ